MDVMMTPQRLPNPALQRRRLFRALTGLRKKAGLKQMDVAGQLRWSQSKLARIESGEVGISYTDLKALLGLYGVTDADFESMAEMAEAARHSSPPEQIEMFPRPFRRYLENEEVAKNVRQFENSYIPGLLQTADYARTVIRQSYRTDELSEGEIHNIADEIERKTAFRVKRQDLLREGHLTGEFVIDEGVVRRTIGAESGNPQVMAEQLTALKNLADQPGIDIRILPFSAGAHDAMSGPFVVLDYADVDDPPLLYIENSLDDIATTDEPARTGRFITVFEKIQSVSLAGPALHRLLDEVIDTMT